MAKEKIELGMDVEDKVSGFRGRVISIARFLSGCDRVLVQPPAVKNTLPEAQNFDITELEFIGNGLYVPPKPRPARKTGGPRQFPGRSR